MSKKPSKVQESATPYTAKQPVKAARASKTETAGVRHMDEATFKNSSAKVFKTHRELFRKLAQ